MFDQIMIELAPTQTSETGTNYDQLLPINFANAYFHVGKYGEYVN